MATGRNIDGLLVQWGDRLFYPANRIVRPDLPPRLHTSLGHGAAIIRQRIAATVVRHAPQVALRITGGGKGMGAIANHLRYISQTGRLPFEDDREVTREGREALRNLVDQWRYGGAFIADVEHRREARYILLGMPAGTDADRLLKAAREFARIELAGHRYVMVLHRHQTSPHVHLCVKLESISGERLHPGKPDLSRWRETFAERLRASGIDAEASRPAARGEIRAGVPMWHLKARDAGREQYPFSPTKNGAGYRRSCIEAITCWTEIAKALRESDRADDRQLAPHVTAFMVRTPFIAETLRKHPQALPEVRRYLEAHSQRAQQLQPTVTRERSGPEWTR